MRVGGRMMDVWWAAKSWPGLSKRALAASAALDSDPKPWLRAVDRAIRVGILNAEGDPTSGYALYAVPQSRWGSK